MKTIKKQFNNLALKLIERELITQLKANQAVTYQITEHSTKFGKVSYEVNNLRSTIERDVITFNDANNLLLESDYVLKGFLFESVQAVEVINPVSARITFTNGDYISISEVA